MSYPVMTPSAARGLLEAVLWKPGMRWHIEQINVLAPIRFIAFRRNEVNHKASAPPSRIVDEGGAVPVLIANDEDNRAQRNTLALRDVDYVIEAAIGLTDRAGPDDTIMKFMAMFNRRVEKGQYFHCPYLGCREFVAQVLRADDAPAPIPDTRDLGIMLWDIEYAPDGNRARFFAAKLLHGVLEVPDDPESTLATVGGAP
jgi:CRISPR-associated protein Cas5d